MILGPDAMISSSVVLLDWERAPLASVFFSHAVDEDYELELDDGRTVEGTVLRRAVLRCADQRVLELDDGTVALTRDSASGEWIAGPGRMSAGPALREPGSRSKSSSPIEVELDQVQRQAVELERDRSLLVLGEAGFGKTTVALHRVVHLRAEARAAKRPFCALVLVPTQGLRRLLFALLERLGADEGSVPDIDIRTFHSWIGEQARRVFADLPRRDSENAPLAVARVKRHPAVRPLLPEIVAGTAAMREVAAGYREDEVTRTAEQLLHLFGDRALLERAAAASGGALTPRMIDQVIAHTKILFSPTTERVYADVDADRLHTADGLAIDAGTPMNDAGTLDPEDFAVLFELQHLRTGSDAGSGGALTHYDHIVVDEAQEFASIELAVIGRARAEGGSITIAGDEHQQVDETTVFGGWTGVMAELGLGDGCERVVLQESYRCPPVVEAFARGLFAERQAIDRDDPALHLGEVAHELELVSVVIAHLLEIRRRDRLASVAVICRFASSARRMYALLSKGVDCRLVVDGDFRFGPGISVTCVDEVKGLEFDYVIIPDASAANYPDTGEARRALYVAATRALARLWLLWSGRASVLI